MQDLKPPPMAGVFSLIQQDVRRIKAELVEIDQTIERSLVNPKAAAATPAGATAP
ncbi:MAG: hypothetical protein IT435_14410 [Phycisphaerales bacterium]|nr:hypothetical protein [Phycisphaerales bacterium]